MTPTLSDAVARNVIVVFLGIVVPFRGDVIVTVGNVVSPAGMGVAVGTAGTGVEVGVGTGVLMPVLIDTTVIDMGLSDNVI